MTPSSRDRAQEWPYPRHDQFERDLRLHAASWFRRRNYEVHPRYPYLLASWEMWAENIIVPEVAEYLSAVRREREARHQGFPLHKYVHHGLSSQAMLLNLVGPLVVRQDLALLQRALQSAGVVSPGGDVSADFEVEDRAVFNEDNGQPTSIDLVLRGSDGTRPLFIESKFVEREFGGCSVFAIGDCEGRNPVDNRDDCYLHYIGRKYWSRFDEHRCVTDALLSGPICPLANYYQFFRELLFALHLGGDFVLLYDARNPTFVCPGTDGTRGLLPFLLTFVSEPLRSRIHAVTIQAVFDTVRRSEAHGDWVNEFASKYGY